MTSLALFSFFAALTIGFGCVVAFSREIFRAAFALMGCLIGVAGLTAMLGAVTVAAIHIIIYIGGIFVLFLFAILVTERPGQTVFRRRSTATFLAGILALSIIVLLVIAAFSPALGANTRQAAEFAVTARTIGALFMGDALLLFEAVSVLLLAGLAAAVVVMRKELDS